MRRQAVLMAAILLAGVGARVSVAAEEPASGDAGANRVVARVNQTEITYGEFQKRLDNIQRQRGPVPPEQLKDVVRGMVQEEILLEDATSQGLDQEAAVKEKLEQARRRVLIEELLQRKIIALSNVTDQEMRKMYDDNKPLFSTETVRVSHILVKSEADADAILKDLKGGADFAEVAKAKSQDAGSAEKGGELGELRRGQTVPEFEEAAFALKEGELSPVIKTEYGYHILKGGAHSTSVQPFDEVKGQIQKSLVQQKQQESFTAYMADLEKKAKAEIFEDRLR